MIATATASTDFWPPDYSQMFPDLIVALATGIFVGLFVLVVERLIDWRRARQNRYFKRREAVYLASDTIWRTFHYSGRTLMPNDPELAAIPALLAVVPEGKPWRTVAGYDLLVELVDRRRVLEGDLRETLHWIKVRGKDRKHRRLLRRIALTGDGDITSALPEPTYLQKDRLDFAALVGAVENRRNALDAVRRGFNRADARYKMAIANSYNYRGFEDGNWGLFLQLWRRAIGPIKRRRAAKEADRAGWDLVRAEGYA